jgi:hypothetical protein
MDSSSIKQQVSQQSGLNGKSPYNSPSLLLFIGILLLLIRIVIGYTLASYKNPNAPINNTKNKPVTSPTIQSISVPTASPTLSVSSYPAEQKKYSNPTHGITFMYPNDGIINNNPVNGDYVITVNTKNLIPLLHVQIQNSRDDLIKTNEFEKWYVLSFSIYNNPQNMSLEAIATDTNAYGAKNNFTISKSVSIDGVKGIEGIWQSSDTGAGKIAVFNRGGKTYLFEMFGDNGYYSASGEKILTAILGFDQVMRPLAAVTH